MVFLVEYPWAERFTTYFFYIDLNLFIPSSFSMEPGSSSEEGTSPVIWEMEMNRARLTALLEPNTAQH